LHHAASAASASNVNRRRRGHAASRLKVIVAPSPSPRPAPTVTGVGATIARAAQVRDVAPQGSHAVGRPIQRTDIACMASQPWMRRAPFASLLAPPLLEARLTLSIDGRTLTRHGRLVPGA
jgi:hypothetical protein